MNKNNPVTKKTTVQSSTMNLTLESAEYSYEYENNYPTKVICKNIDEDGSVDVETLIYEY